MRKTTQNVLALLTAVVATCSCLGSSTGKGVLPDVEAGVVGRWELVSTVEGGGPPLTAAPGTFEVFRADHTLAVDCVGAGSSWVLLADGRTIEFNNALGIMFRWRVIELSATTFAFSEDIAEFHYERRAACP